MSNGGQILVKALDIHKVRRVSCVAGESYLPVLDALLDFPQIEVVTCRQEGGAAFMAESWGKLDNAPGVCLVTRGPGACNASIGVHTAKQDSTPMILLMGQVASHEKGREVFQEIDVRKTFSDLAKWATEIERTKDIPAVMEEAFTVAMSGRAGPVVIGLPEDVLQGEADAEPGDAYRAQREIMPEGAVKKIEKMLLAATRPVVIVGGGGWSDEAVRALESFAKANLLPVATAWRRDDLFDHLHDSYAGDLSLGSNPELLKAVKGADLVVAIGARLDSITTQDADILSIPKPAQKLIHIYPGKEELGRVYKADLAIHADVNDAMEKLSSLKIDSPAWASWSAAMNNSYRRWSSINKSALSNWSGADMTLIFESLRKLLPEDAVVTCDAGNFSGWVRRYINYKRPGRVLAPISGAMGYAVPSAVGAAIAQPGRTVLGVCGDGGFMMNGQELATAMHHKASPIILLCNNGIYGTIRMHQERHFPGRPSATDLTNPDFVKLAQSYGAFGARVDHANQFESVFREAHDAGKAALIEIKMDPRQITTNAKL